MNDAIETVIRRKVLQWLNYADENLRLARHALTLSTAVPYRLVAYHAQQCAEKSLKAYLVFFRIDFPCTHNISRLLELCGDNATWCSELLDAEMLSVYAITTPYPGVDEVKRDEALLAIEKAEIVKEAVLRELEKHF